ncbi:MAG TPA: hypothetical protein VK513_13960 [Terriglobales bacterium]|nr:hypothetical protein [Terriglobales bacterium]
MLNSKHWTGILVSAAMVFCCLKPVSAQTADEGNTENLQKATQNPVASLISVPIQNIDNFNIGPASRTQNVLNIQPVIPVRISEDWNLILRWITPVISQPVPATKDVGFFGLGDMQPTFFFSPAHPGRLVWGVGPTFLLPTATSQYTGQGKFGMGPSFVALVQPGHWTIGALANNVWSVAGPHGRPAVNQFLLQYFINYNLEKGWYLTTSPILTANWKAPSGDQWVTPVGGGVGRVCRLGYLPVNITVQVYGNPVRPAGTSPWSLRMQIALLFPKKPQ